MIKSIQTLKKWDSYGFKSNRMEVFGNTSMKITTWRRKKYPLAGVRSSLMRPLMASYRGREEARVLGLPWIEMRKRAMGNDEK